MDEQSDKHEPCDVWKQFWSESDAEISPESADNAGVFGADFSNFWQFADGIFEWDHSELDLVEMSTMVVGQLPRKERAKGVGPVTAWLQ